MVEDKLTTFFEDFLSADSLFLDKRVLSSSYSPINIPHRGKEINLVANILAPALKQEKPSNLFIYGNTGTGKTLVVKHVTNSMNQIAINKNIPLKVLYINCKLKRVADTEYRLIAALAGFLGKSIPPTGLPTDEVYRIFYKGVEHENKIILIVLDEIDQLIKKAGDDVLYNLTRVNEDFTKSQIAIVGISNNASFTEDIDARVKSSLSEEDLFFSPYDALEIKEILGGRLKEAFKENAVEPGIIEKCAAYAAREHGDARKAIELLRVAGELAERSKSKTVSIEHLDDAELKLEREKVFDVVRAQPKQFQLVLFSLISIKTKNSVAYTGEIYELYRKVCFKVGLRPLTQRRVSDIIGEFELMGIINTKTVSKGRYGRTREITLAISPSTIPATKKILYDEIGKPI
jgi:archaeal cell division control protein 6